MSEVYRVAFKGAFRDRARIDDLQIELSAMTAQNGQDVGALLGQSLGTIDWWDRLGAIRTPTLGVHGRQDIAPISMGRALSEAFPNGEPCASRQWTLPPMSKIRAGSLQPSRASS